MLSKCVVDDGPLSETKRHVDKRLTRNLGERHILAPRERVIRRGNKMEQIGSYRCDPKLWIVDVRTDKGCINATFLNAFNEFSGASPRGLQAQLYRRVAAVKIASKRRHIDQSKAA